MTYETTLKYVGSDLFTHYERPEMPVATQAIAPVEAPVVEQLSYVERMRDALGPLVLAEQAEVTAKPYEGSDFSMIEVERAQEAAVGIYFESDSYF